MTPSRSHSRAHFHAHAHARSPFHRFQHRPLHARDPEQQSSADDAANDDSKNPLEITERALAEHNSGELTAQVVVNAVASHDQGVLVTHVRQTISLVQYVDPRGSPYETKTVSAAPDTVVVDSKSGKTIAIFGGSQSDSALRGSAPSRGEHTVPSRGSITSTWPATLTPTSTPETATTKTAYPSAADIRNSTNSTISGNSLFTAPSNSSSSHQFLSSSVPISIINSSTTSVTNSNSKSTHSTLLASSSSSSSSSSSPPYVAPGSGFGTVTAPGTLQTRPPETDPGSGENLTPQQKQVIGGVVGAVAGVAVIGLLLMLLLRWKKKKGGSSVLDDQPGATSSRALGAGLSGNSGPGRAMTDKRAASGAVAAALASLSGTREPQTSHSADSGERGFYRVSGRKLPSVLRNGGDGYTDPRGSATSGSSDYHRGSQAFEPKSSAGGQLALGAPMRPVSGVPIIRSGPARLPITQNPFADPHALPDGLPSGTLGSRESPKASGSKFQEKI
ncbi:uncharacterized protein MAM_00510 [Metarhizium album ARSEF 1941]|uniref:Uncharacterized protein n=1 Tax=Metarhizium album (strain ARSEF 1941) TaxID=1081103 RepID=A0A0B2X558_METAS|nr:uncharacterized protein MAM_00510 [Metarhizium album ARSEF 1941]KHO01509.1 hypothetical protein MAM_00510 [Metarhizium album ARSEF 1941]